MLRDLHWQDAMVFNLENLLAADPTWRYKLLGVLCVIVVLIMGGVWAVLYDQLP